MKASVLLTVGHFFVVMPLFGAQLSKTAVMQQSASQKVMSAMTKNASYAYIINKTIQELTGEILLKEFALKCAEYKENNPQLQTGMLVLCKEKIVLATANIMREYVADHNRNKDAQEYIREKITESIIKLADKYFSEPLPKNEEAILSIARNCQVQSSPQETSTDQAKTKEEKQNKN